MDITELDFILLMIIGYGTGVASGLCYCVKYRNAFLTRTSSNSFTNAVEFADANRYGGTIIPSPILASASAPPAHNPMKLTIE